MKTAGDRNLERGLQSASIGELSTARDTPEFSPFKSRTAVPTTFLVIGYGNELRSDDGVGAKVAATVEKWKSPLVNAIVCHQLTPELAEPISAAQSVVFVDATVNGEISVDLRRIEAAASPQTMAHAADPGALLCLAKSLFGRCPPAYMVTIPIENVAFGEELSPLADVGFQIALRKIQLLTTSG